MTDRLPIKTTQTVFDILEVLIDEEGVRLHTLVDELDMPRSTVHDHLRSLETIGLVINEDGGYRVGTRFLEIGERIKRQHRTYQAAHDQVRSLADETGEHSSLMIEEQGLGVLLDVEKGADAVNIDAYAGRRLALPPHAPGKAILANLPRERVDQIVEEHGLPEYTPATTTDIETLHTELDRIADQGYAVDEGELVEGVKAISAPIVVRGDVMGAITIGGPANRMQGDRFDEDLPDLLLRSSNIVELNLAYP